LALSAAGIDTKRGDRISVAAVDFAPTAFGGEGASGLESTSFLMSLASTGIKSLTILLLAAIVVMAGFRPAMRILLTGSETAALGSSAQVAALAGRGNMTGDAGVPLDMPEMSSPLLEPGANPFDTDSGMSGLSSGLGSGLASGLASGMSF